MQEKMQKIEKLSVKVVTCKEVSLLLLGKCVTLYSCHLFSAATQLNMPVTGAEKKDTNFYIREQRKDFLIALHAKHVS